MAAGFVIEPLGSHDRTVFDCGADVLNRYFRERVSQDVRRRLSGCFVAVDEAQRLAGFYTLAAASLPLTELPEDERKRLPRYQSVPAALIGRVAVSVAFQRRGLGAALILDAIDRTARAEVVAFALIVDAKDVAATAFYAHLGFRPFVGRPRSLYLPISEAMRLLRALPA